MKSQTELNIDSTTENACMSEEEIESYLSSIEKGGNNSRRPRKGAPVGHGRSRKMLLAESGQDDDTGITYESAPSRWARSRDIDPLYIKSEVEVVA